MSEDDDLAWLEGLAGRAAAPTGGAAKPANPDIIEAVALREFIRRAPEAEMLEISAVDAEREHQLIERARAQGLLRARIQIMPTPWLSRRTAFAAAAGVVLAAIGLTVFLNTSRPPPETLRGGGVVHLKAADGAALKRQLTEELRAAGARVTGYDRLGRPGIDVDLPQPLTPELRRILEQHGLPIPADGVLTIEIEPTEK